MRRLILLSLVVCAGCSPRMPDPVANTTGTAETSVAANTTATGANGMRGNEPKASVSAAEAKATVMRYFALIKRRDFATARLLWGNHGEDTRGTPRAFAESITMYSEYVPKVGDPTEIKAASGQQYIAVETALHVKLRATGGVAERTGVVMLRRSVDPKTTDADKRDWRIWGIDIRSNH